MNNEKRENIIFIGLPGCGKSSFAKRIAKDFYLKYEDTDDLIEEANGMLVSDIFRTHGEAYFREVETQAIEVLASDKRTANGGCIISVGGGAVLKKENVDLLKGIGKVVFIDRKASDIVNNMRFAGDRPLLKSKEDVLRLDSERRSIYEDIADIVFNNDGEYFKELERLKSLVVLIGVCGSMCLIGDPVKHSLSPKMHYVIFKMYNIYGKYMLALVHQDELIGAVGYLRAGNLTGLNVTKPHKRAVIDLVDELRGDAALARSVNTIKKEGDSLIGYNTDMEGLALALARGGRGYRDASVMILGAGGVSIGIATKAFAEGAAAVTVVCRRPETGMREAFPKDTNLVIHNFSSGTANEGSMFADALANTDILINSTPLGMSGWQEDFKNFEFLDMLSSKTLVCDLIYEPPETSLLHEASKRKLDTLNGLPMLIYQGILSDEILFDITTDREKIYNTIHGYIFGNI